MERCDIYDAERRPLGKTRPRGAVLPRGEYHLTAFVWVFNSAGQVLLTRRAPEKKSYPNQWAMTGGAVQAGEDTRQAICRELREETGLRAQPEAFWRAETFRFEDTICDVFFLRMDAPIGALTLQPEETSEARWVDSAELERMIAKRLIARPDALHYAQFGDKLDGWIK